MTSQQPLFDIESAPDVELAAVPIARTASQIPPLSNPPVRVPSTATAVSSPAPRTPSADGEYSYLHPQAASSTMAKFEAERQRALELQREGISRSE